MFDRGKTYSDDVALLKEYGIEPFDVELHKEHFVGKADLEDGNWVNIWVTCTPAQFYRFEIHDEDGKRTYMVNTGSGGLSNFWPTVRLMATNMFVVEGMKEE